MNCEKISENKTILEKLNCKIILKDELECKIEKKKNQRENFLSLKMFEFYKSVRIESKHKLKMEFTNISNKMNVYIREFKFKNIFNSESIIKILRKTPNIVSLIITKNKLNFQSKLNELKKLQYLDFSFNSIDNLNFLNEFKCDYLNYLDLSSNPILILNIPLFHYLKIIKLNRMNLLIPDMIIHKKVFQNIQQFYISNSEFTLNKKKIIFLKV